MVLMSEQVVIRQVAKGDSSILADFFAALSSDPETVTFFHPHAFTTEFAAQLCEAAATRKDRYYVACFQGVVIAYMMLRGWDEGYSVPSFGVCAHPALRDVGLGQALMAHAVAECRAAGAPKLRLTVFKDNVRGVHVYSKFGFVFTDKNEHELIGILDLASSPQIPVRSPNLLKIKSWFQTQTQAA
jgi:ribosomal protein S18 acetylase RimI-like enzyme